MTRSHRISVLALLLIAGTLAAVRAPAQSVEREGFQAEAAFRVNTLLGGFFPYSETGLGFQGAVRRVWPSGVSLALGGIYAQPEDLSLNGGSLSRQARKAMEEYGTYAEVRYEIPDLGAVAPYAGVRAGWKTIRSESVPEADGGGVMGGILAGTEIRLSDRIGLRVNGVASSFRISGFVPERPSSASSWSLEAGVSYFFGNTSRDADGDGVRDAVDRCADTPGGVEVNAAGCLPDGDGDGLPDLRDACPDSPAGVAVDDRGCARDGDRDGVPDRADECPGTPEGASVDERGCVADADGDGVTDTADDCPDTPTGADVDASGCSLDTDGDGVADGLDRCPETVSGVATDESGCSEVQAGLRQGRYSLGGLPFRFREVQVNEELEQRLQQIGREMRRNSDLHLEIRVHTDTLGPAEYNRQMSQKLAESARDYLLRQFPDIGGQRLEAVGAGETPPGGEGEDPVRESQASRVVFIVSEGGSGGSSDDGVR